MYFRYHVARGSDGGRYDRIEEISLFGCNVGQIPAILRARSHLIDPSAGTWHIDMEQEFAPTSEAFVISLKPKNKNPSKALSLYELRDVWGISDAYWTRLMLRLRGLVVDNEPPVGNPADFRVPYLSEHESIFTFLFLDGGIENCAVSGKWTPTRPSPTNSLLLWPTDLQHFLRCIRATAPKALGEGAV